MHDCYAAQVSALEGIVTHQVAVGFGFSMFLVDDSNPAVAKLPVFETSVPKETAAPEAEEKGEGEGMPASFAARNRNSVGGWAGGCACEYLLFKNLQTECRPG